MYKQDKQIKVKEGLYIKLGKAKGYSVIEYNPFINDQQLRKPIFSTNCKLDCKIDKQTLNNTSCCSCGSSLNLYYDSMMGMFKNKIRIDLDQHKYCNISAFWQQNKNQYKWDQLPPIDSQQLSHIKLSQALSSSKCQGQKQIIKNFYEYQVMPIPHHRSYWQDYHLSEEQYICIYPIGITMQNGIINSRIQYKLCVRVGENRQYLIDNCQLQVVQGCICNNTLSIIYRSTKSCYFLYIYEISQQENPPKQIEPVYKIQLSEQNINEIHLQHNNEQLIIMYTDNEKQQLKIISIENILSSKLEITHFKMALKLQNSYIFVYANQKKHVINSISLTDELITVTKLPSDNAHVKILQIQNKHKIKSIHGYICHQNKQRLYFYCYGSHHLHIIIYQYTIPNLIITQVEYAQFVVHDPQQFKLFKFNCPNELGNVYLRPKIDGCLFYMHSLQNGQPISIKACFL